MLGLKVILLDLYLHSFKFEMLVTQVDIMIDSVLEHAGNDKSSWTVHDQVPCDAKNVIKVHMQMSKWHRMLEVRVIME